MPETIESIDDIEKFAADVLERCSTIVFDDEAEPDAARAVHFARLQMESAAHALMGIRPFYGAAVTAQPA